LSYQRGYDYCCSTEIHFLAEKGKWQNVTHKCEVDKKMMNQKDGGKKNHMPHIWQPSFNAEFPVMNCSDFTAGFP
jgi:hypothetical protein